MGELNLTGRKDPTDEQKRLLFSAAQQEEMMLRHLDMLKNEGAVDLRALALARTHLEEAFMWYSRAVWPKGRIELPEDGEPQG